MLASEVKQASRRSAIGTSLMETSSLSRRRRGRKSQRGRPSLQTALNISAPSTVRARPLFSRSFDFVIDDLSRFGESFGRSGERCGGSQLHPVFIVYRHDETRLTREIETMEMVSL
jgi:hypothetical protein